MENYYFGIKKASKLAQARLTIGNSPPMLFKQKRVLGRGFAYYYFQKKKKH